jgi:hypothetical protein
MAHAETPLDFHWGTSLCANASLRFGFLQKCGFQATVAAGAASKMSAGLALLRLIYLPAQN